MVLESSKLKLTDSKGKVKRIRRYHVSVNSDIATSVIRPDIRYTLELTSLLKCILGVKRIRPYHGCD